MGKKETFHGYGPEQGYGFLKEALKAITLSGESSWTGMRFLFPTAPKAM